MEKFDYYTLRWSKYGGVDVLGWSTYRSGVLQGQPRKVFLDSFEDEEEARKAFPLATNFSSSWTEPQVSLNHLPCENDAVAGGMYPDDWE